MSSDHVDFYLGTGPDTPLARLAAELGGPVNGLADEPAAESSVDGDLAAVFAAENADTYETAVVGLLAHRATEGVFVVMPGLDGQPGWPWVACDLPASAGTPARSAKVECVCPGAAARGPRPSCPASPAASPPARPRSCPFSPTPPTPRRGPRRSLSPSAGQPIPITQTMQPVPHTYFDRRAETARAVAGAAELVVRRHWPVGDLATTAIREIMARPAPARPRPVRAT